MVLRNIWYAPAWNATTLLVAVHIFCMAGAMVGIVLTQYKAQFYSESEVTKGLYVGAGVFFWAVFVLSMMLICFGLMQRKHLRHVSADYPEVDLRTGRKSKFLLGTLVLSAVGCIAGFAFGAVGIDYMQTRCVRPIDTQCCLRECWAGVCCDGLCALFCGACRLFWPPLRNCVRWSSPPRMELTLAWELDEPVNLTGDGNLLELSILQTVEGPPQTWKDLQDRSVLTAATESAGRRHVFFPRDPRCKTVALATEPKSPV
jgi:hypothetical protein